LAFSQITRTTPFLRTILHLGQIRLTDERTFMTLPFPLPLYFNR
jgi:hypothetical protein